MKNKNKNKYLVSKDSNTSLSSSVLLTKHVNSHDNEHDHFLTEGLFSLGNYDKNIPAIFDSLNLEERQAFVDSLQGIRHFNVLYAHNKEKQEHFHNKYDPDFSRSGYLNKPLSIVVPFIYSENLIKKIAKHHNFSSKSFNEFSVFFSSLNAENQQKCYNIFKDDLLKVIYNDDHRSQFISVLKSESLIRQFIIDHQATLSSIDNFYNFSSLVNIELKSVEDYTNLFSYLNERNKKKFYELFRDKILIYFITPKEIALIINTLNSFENVKDFISGSKIIFKINCKLNEKDKSDSLSGIQELFKNLDIDKFALVLYLLKNDKFYDSSFLSDPLVISRFILELTPDKKKIFFESFSEKDLDFLIKDKKKLYNLFNFFEKQEISDLLKYLSFNKDFSVFFDKLNFIARIKNIFSHQQNTKIGPVSSNVNNQFFFMNVKRTGDTMGSHDIVSKEDNLRGTSISPQ